MLSDVSRSSTGKQTLSELELEDCALSGLGGRSWVWETATRAGVEEHGDAGNIARCTCTRHSRSLIRAETEE